MLCSGVILEVEWRAAVPSPSTTSPPTPRPPTPTSSTPPTTIMPPPRPGTPPPSEHRPLLKDRLYIGNLHPSVDEYTLLQVFSKFGKITKLDWLFHKTGLLKGKPRGYAFVEYASQDDALRALSSAHGKPLRGRTLVVTFAHQAPLDQYGGAGTPASLRGRKTMMDVGRPTTLSMLKTGMRGRHEGKTQDKIAMMEAKLRQMERTNPRPAAAVPRPHQVLLSCHLQCPPRWGARAIPRRSR
ncbi:hypothetical protein BJ912DRAFT_877976 [Pholiota molesta]|nr:hypothetical protein BJ912DRAFT_877976 [Pholiota molesta]